MSTGGQTDRQSLGCWPSALALNVSTRRMVECETITHWRWALIIGYERILKYISTFHGDATGSWIDCAESGLVIVKQLLHRFLHHGLECKSSQISALTPPPPTKIKPSRFILGPSTKAIKNLYWHTDNLMLSPFYEFLSAQ